MPPHTYLVSQIVSNQTLEPSRIMTLYANKNIRFYGYDSTTRNDGALTKALGTDEFGNVILGTVAGRQTLQQTFDTEVGGSILTKNDTARLGSTNLRFHTTGGFNNGIYMYENDSNYTIIKKSRIQLWASGRQFPDIHFLWAFVGRWWHE
jgi:hypothetical protein